MSSAPMDHPDWPAFLSAIVANPDDDTARLVAADFLEENGDPDRAAFIRVQIKLAQLEADGQGKSLEADHWRAKERAFLGPLSMYPTLWGAEACPELVRVVSRRDRDPLEGMRGEGAERLRWHRGFVFAVRCTAQEWQRHGLAIRKRQPVTELGLTECDALTVPDWMGMAPALLGLNGLWLASMYDPARLAWFRSLLPGVKVNPFVLGL